MPEQMNPAKDQELLAPGEARGFDRGQEVGERCGEERGRLLAYREVLRLQLEGRFAPLPKSILQQIDSADLPALRRALTRVDRLRSLTELFLEVPSFAPPAQGPEGSPLPGGRMSRAEMWQEIETMLQELVPTWEQGLLARGEELGELKAYRKGLQRLLKKRFVRVPDELLRRIEWAKLPTLEAAVDQVFAIRSLEELAL